MVGAYSRQVSSLLIFLSIRASSCFSSVSSVREDASVPAPAGLASLSRAMANRRLEPSEGSKILVCGGYRDMLAVLVLVSSKTKAGGTELESQRSELSKAWTSETSGSSATSRPACSQ